MLCSNERDAPPTLAEIGSAVTAVLSDARELSQECRAARRDLNRVIAVSRQLRADLEAERRASGPAPRLSSPAHRLLTRRG